MSLTNQYLEKGREIISVVEKQQDIHTTGRPAFCPIDLEGANGTPLRIGP